jgi:antitoxin MazE
MLVSVKKWGNSASVRIPASVMRAARLELNQTVEIREEEGRIVIEPAVAPEYDIAALVAGIIADNRHDEIDLGGPVGKEIW